MRTSAAESSKDSEPDSETVGSHFDIGVSGPGEDLGAEVGQNQAVGAESVSVVGDARIVEVHFKAGFEKAAFADEKVRALRVALRIVARERDRRETDPDGVARKDGEFIRATLRTQA